MAKPIEFTDLIMEKIFSHLDSKTKLNASLVNKKWLKHFTDNPDLMQDVCVYFIACSLTDAFDIFKDTMTRKFSCFYFKDLTIDKKFFDFLEKFSPQFRSLTFNKCKVPNDIYGRKLESCNRLLKLRVWDCNALGIFSHISTLKSLHFEISKSQIERDMILLREIAPFSLTDFGMVDLGEREAEYMNTGYFQDVRDFIERRSSSLKSLDFTGLIFLDADMHTLSNIEDLRLKRFKVSSHFVKERTIGRFCNKQRWIVALELGDHISPRDRNASRRDSCSVRDDHVVTICTALPQLEELTLSCCTRINVSVATIFRLRFLRKLNLPRCRGIKARSFQSALARLACTDLKNLNLWETLIEPSTLSQLLTLVPKLGEITLSHGYFLDDSAWVECPRSRTGGQSYGFKFVRQLD